MRLLLILLFATGANACLDRSGEFETRQSAVAPTVVTPTSTAPTACALPAAVANPNDATTDGLVAVDVPRFEGVTHDFANVEFRDQSGQVLQSWDTSGAQQSGRFTVRLPQLPQGTSYFIVDACERSAAEGRQDGAPAAARLVAKL